MYRYTDCIVLFYGIDVESPFIRYGYLYLKVIKCKLKWFAHKAGFSDKDM